MDSLTVLAPTFYPNAEHPVTRYFRESAARHQLPVRYYGIGVPYADWFQVQITALLDELHRVTTSHVLYTDASDVVVTAGMDHIRREYERLGEPSALISVEPDGVNAGGWIANRNRAVGILATLRDMDLLTSNPQERWRAAIERRTISRVARDDESAIFHCMNGGDLEYAKGVGYTVNGNAPVFLHFCGGYTDPEKGKAEQIEPVWKELGYDGQ